MAASKKMIISLAVFCMFALICNANADFTSFNTLNILSASENIENSDAAPAEEEKVEQDETINWKNLGYNILWYLPNRLLDLADCFTIEFEAGDYGADVYLTRYANIGAGAGYSYGMGWSHGRQYGFFNEPNYNANFLCFGTESKQRKNILGSYKYFNYTNTSCADIFMFPDTLKHEDPYAIGAKVSFLVGAKVQFHPVEFADFIAGLFLFDISNDDRIKTISR